MMLSHRADSFLGGLVVICLAALSLRSSVADPRSSGANPFAEFDVGPLPSFALRGRTVAVIGTGSVGIPYFWAFAATARDCTIILASRDSDKAARIVDAIRSTSGYVGYRAYTGTYRARAGDITSRGVDLLGLSLNLAVRKADIIVMAVPYPVATDLFLSWRPLFQGKGKIVIDLMNPYQGQYFGRAPCPGRHSSTQCLIDALAEPTTLWTTGLKNQPEGLYGPNMSGLHTWAAGNDTAKAALAALVQPLGMRVINVGDMAEAPYYEAYPSGHSWTNPTTGRHAPDGRYFAVSEGTCMRPQVMRDGVRGRWC